MDARFNVKGNNGHFWLLTAAILTWPAILASHSPSVPWPIVLPVSSLCQARQQLGSSQNYTTEFPPWVNTTLLTLGQKFMADNFHGFEYASALTTLLMVVDTQRVLISGGNTTLVERAARRYLINVLHFYYWATADLGSEELYESLNLIHAVHAKVGHEAKRKHKMFEKPLIPTPPRGQNPFLIQTKVWDAFERDLLASPLRKLRGKEIFPPRDGKTIYPLNQFAMATQLYAFIAYPVISPGKMLIPTATDEELWGYVHFWAFIGRGLGIRDEYNVCLQPDLQTAKTYFREVLKQYFIPSLLSMTYEHKAVIEVYVKSAESILGYADLGMILNLVCQDVLEIECPHLSRMVIPRAGSNLLTVARPLFKYEGIKKGMNFMLNSLVQKQTMRYFRFNPIFKGNFTRGILQLDYELLKTSGLHYFRG